MKLISRNDIENWAKTAISKSDLPELISKLVRATTPSSTRINFPSGSTAFIGGWDGEVFCAENTSYVPEGCSLFELGTEANPKGKADSDYDKRKKDPLGHNPKDCIFIFITPRYWKFKDKWVKEKRAEGFWKNVIVYDSCSLEQWLEYAFYVSSWFADYLGKVPLDGSDIAEIFWKYWSEYRGMTIFPEAITAGRNREMELIANFLNADPDITFVRAASKSEATAFIIATAKQFQPEQTEYFFSRAIVVTNETAYKRIAANYRSPLILIPTFENKLPMYSAVSNSHHVIVPLGADDDTAKESTILPTIDRDGQIEALMKSGIDKDDASRFSRESGRNITILKKLIGFPHNKTKWLEEQDIREIVPALLLGRWEETFTGDIELLEKLSGKKYAEYKSILNKWKNFEESPILQIGETWRLTSPLDIWTNLISQLTENDFLQLQECFSKAFKSGNPIAKPEDDSFAARFNKKRTFSSWAREGLTQSLILVSRLSNSIAIPGILNPTGWVEAIISDLLEDATGDLWISLDREMPLISEASPDSFLSAVKKSLANEEPEILNLFQEKNGLLHKTSHHTGLLWALEGLAWLPEYLRDASLILLQLARLDPGGNLTNRPINSIVEIYKPWHYQTLASFEERMHILEYVTDQEKEMGWALLVRLLPDGHSVGMPTHKMRWRMFDMNTNISRTWQEIWNTHTAIIEMLINLFDYDENKFGKLIHESATLSLSKKNRIRVLEWADGIYQDVKQKQFTTWNTLRGILHHHRSHPDTKWALPGTELLRYEDLYYKLEPEDVIEKNIWLFNNHTPEFIDGFPYDDKEFEKRHQKRQEQVNKIRTTAVKNIIDELGLEKTLALRKQVKEQGILGDAMARVELSDEDVLLVCDTLNDEDTDLRFIHSFIFQKSIGEGFNWIKDLFDNLKEKGYGSKALSNVLIPLNQNQTLWDFISEQSSQIQDCYWKNVWPSFFHASEKAKVYGLKRLLAYNRFFSAINAAYLKTENIPSAVLVEILEKTATEKADDKAHFKGREVERIFEELDKRDDVESSKLIQLEWYFLAVMDTYRANRNPKNLEEALAKDPSFFIDVLKWLYLPKDKKLLEKEREGISDEIIRNRGKQSYHLLNNWKAIPGLRDDKSIDKDELAGWINTVRNLAQEVNRLEVADAEIGKLLAQYPEDAPQWPQETIFQIIEDINTDNLKRNYSSGMYNKRSFTSRGPYDGGEIERERATYFQKLADDHKIKYPNVSKIFKQMADGYLRDAKREDDEAERNKLEY